MLKIKNYKRLLFGSSLACFAVFLSVFLLSHTYIQNLVYQERLSQMEEVTHQMFHSLEEVLDAHWDDVDVQCNFLTHTPLETTEDLFSYLEMLSALSN